MIIRYDETAKDSNLTTNSLSINYPITNILDSRLTRIYRTIAGTTTSEIVFDAGSAIDVSSICIANHNITSSVSTLKIQGNNTDSWGTPAFEQSITWNSGIMFLDFTEQSFQFWRIQIIDATNPDTFIEIGRVWIGKAYITPGIAFPVLQDRKSESVRITSISGQSYMDKRYQADLVSMKFPKLSETEKNTNLEIFDIVDVGIPFFITFNKAGATLGTLYVTFDLKSLKVTELGRRNLYTMTMKFIEEV